MLEPDDRDFTYEEMEEIAEYWEEKYWALLVDYRALEECYFEIRTRAGLGMEKKNV
jgi:hypothetical protein